MSKLNQFKESVPNDWKFLDKDEDIDEIVIGGSATHTFELPFNYDKVVKSATITYKQGLEVKLSIPVTKKMVVTIGNKSVIYVYLPPVYTETFDDTILDTYCQLEVIQFDGKILYDEQHKIKVVKPISSSKVIAPVSDVVINGESIVEDGIAVIPNIATADFSNTCLFRLPATSFNNLVYNHYLVLDQSQLDIPPELFTVNADVLISVGFDTILESIKLNKNGKHNYTGELVIKYGANVYEIAVNLLTNADGTIAVLRSADLN